jgi:hypothetical protein
MSLSIHADPAALQDYRSPRLRAKLVTAAFFVYAAACTWCVWSMLHGIAIGDAIEAGADVDPDAYTAWAASLEGIDIKLIGVQLFGVVAFLFWTHRVTANARAFGGLGESPGWAVGYYFMPFLNLYRPYRILADVYIDSDPDPSPDRWSGRRAVPLFFPAWWLVWTLVRIGERLIESTMRDPETFAESKDMMITSIGAIGVEMVALLLMLAVVWSLTRRQEQRMAAGGLARASVVR